MEAYSIKEFQLTVRDKPSVPAKILPFVGKQFTSSLDIYTTFRDIEHLPQESFFALHLDGKNKLIGMTVSSIGSLTGASCHPREIFRPALLNMTAGLIFVHNHPSGDPHPSMEDIQMTKRLFEVGKLIGICCLDHIVVGTDRYFSFADEGMM